MEVRKQQVEGEENETGMGEIVYIVEEVEEFEDMFGTDMEDMESTKKTRGISPEAGEGEHKTRISQPLPPCEFSPPSFRYRSKKKQHKNKATFEFQAAPFQHIKILTFQQF